jgi:hypothetical protein
MMTAIQVNDELYNEAKMYAKAEHRTVSGQIEFWALMGRTALDNPDLPIDFVRDLLIAKAEDLSLATPFIPEGERYE